LPIREKVRILIELQPQDLPLLAKQRPLRAALTAHPTMKREYRLRIAGGERHDGVAMVRRRLPLEHTDIEIPEIESSRQRRDPQRTRAPRQYLANRLNAGSLFATSFAVACECKLLTRPGWCIPRSTVVEITP
jgi:hypothetical protein